MSTATIFNYMDLLRQGGVKEHESETYARALGTILADVKQEIKQEVRQEIKEKISPNDLATKGDVHRLEIAIEKVRYDALKFTIWTGVSVVVVLSGMLAKGFHWF